MAWLFGESWDCYTLPADAANGYWDTGTTTATTGASFSVGRFAGSQALNPATTTGVLFTKTSGQNDAVHHISVAHRHTGTLTGTILATYLQLLDGATGQCAIVFRSDGTILLTSGTAGGTVLATYAGAVAVSSTWYQFEFEIVINNTTGSFKVRKNGSTTDDHSTTGIDTQVSANAYANKLILGTQALGVTTHHSDDLLWRSDASSVAWLGDIRCITRYPASDSSVQFSRAPTSYVQALGIQATTAAITAGTARYGVFTAAYDGTISTATVTLTAGYTGNMKCSLFASASSAPTTVLGSASPIVNPATGSNTFTFGTPVSVTRGTQYWIGFDSDTSSGTFALFSTPSNSGTTSTTPYASFPAASPTIGALGNGPVSSVTIALTTNYGVVAEAQQDTTTSYVYDSTAGHADLYGIASIASTPASTIAVTTRAYMQKSDAGSRTGAVQIKSGGTTVASSTLTLTTSGWQWAWRTDLTDPNTGSAWTASAVAAATVGPKVVA